MSEQALEKRDMSKVTLGFWIYLMTDCVLFASLFASYAVLRGGTAGGESGKELFDLQFVLLETVILLCSSLTAGLALVFARANKAKVTTALLLATLILGLAFVSLEISEFAALVSEGNSWTRSAFLSSYFTLVGTHGLHICIGLIWLVSLLATYLRYGISYTLLKRFMLFTMFWHFLDIVWIFIFTLVYLFGAIA